MQNTDTEQIKTFLIFREVPVLNGKGIPIAFNHIYLGPFDEPVAEDKYKTYLKSRTVHESVLKIEIGKPYPVKVEEY